VVTHDLGLAWNIADRLAVMYLGRLVEVGPTEQVLADPLHPYTQALLSVLPQSHPREPVVLHGEPPDPAKIPAGCRFHPRCPALVTGRAAAVAHSCSTAVPAVLPGAGAHRAACWLAPTEPLTSPTGPS
jgi:oligopeptide/dipeptide ABC transporter ATP-binding protein